MSDTLTATGRCAEVSERGDWTTFHIDVGRQYPVKLSTKLSPLVELGRAASKDGGAFDWTYTESQGGENPHKPGTFYTNRYLQGVEAAGSQPAQSVATPASIPQEVTSLTRQGVTVTRDASAMTPEKWDAKERRDYRSRAWAQTISALTHTIKVDETAGDVFVRLYALQRKIYRDIVRDFDPEAFEDDDLPFG